LDQQFLHEAAISC